ncbi:MAG: shikimate dehydrogenase [Armatimonadetes bacterium]|nr:shikimate dehydrogenase [Armatimonadota bacterium]
MTQFAFILHPLRARDAARKYPIAKYLPESWVEAIIAKKRPMVLSEIKGIRSVHGEETSGWFIGLPLTPRQLTQTLPVEFVYSRLLECCQLAGAEGAKVIGLGAFTAVAGDAGVTLAQRSPIAVTTGNSYTVATAIEGALKACTLLEIVPERSSLAVVGATGSIGKTCAHVLGRSFGRTILIGRDLDRTKAVAETLRGAEATTDLNRLREADCVVTVTSSDAAIILPQHLRPGSVICDVARPRDVSCRVANERPDVLVIEGGLVEVPGDVNFGMNFGLEPKTAYACMAETIMLALENRAESYSLGKDVTVEQVDETQRWAQKHGFRLAGFRSFETAVSTESIERARKARLALQAQGA